MNASQTHDRQTKNEEVENVELNKKSSPLKIFNVQKYQIT